MDRQRIAFISDIHGNFPALKAVIADIKKQKCDNVISVGDVAGYYCMVNECIDLLKELEIPNILGNHDYYLTSGTGCPRSTTANICIEYQKNHITDSNMVYLRNSVQKIDTPLYSARHGGWNNELDEYIEKFDFTNLPKQNSKIYISGHTHVQTLQERFSYSYFNPGAVGQPRDDDSRAAYAYLDDGKITLRRVEYDIDEIAFEMKKEGFSERTYKCLYYGKKIGDV